MDSKEEPQILVEVSEEEELEDLDEFLAEELSDKVYVFESAPPGFDGMEYDEMDEDDEEKWEKMMEEDWADKEGELEADPEVFLIRFRIGVPLKEICLRTTYTFWQDGYLDLGRLSHGNNIGEAFLTFRLQKQWEAEDGGLLAEYRIEGIRRD